jgi:hypothetical protein
MKASGDAGENLRIHADGSSSQQHESLIAQPQVYSYGYNAYSQRNEPYPYVFPSVAYSPPTAISLPHQSYPYLSQPGYDRVYSSYQPPPSLVLAPRQGYATPSPPWKQTLHPPHGASHFPVIFHDHRSQTHDHFSPPGPPSPIVPPQRTRTHRPSDPPYSPMTQNHPRPKLDFETIVGRVHEMSQDQAGCKILQKLVKYLSQDELEILFHEIASVLPLIFRDVFGNYFFQCYFEHSNYDLKYRIIQTLSFAICSGAMNNYGTRSIQFLITRSAESRQLLLLLKSYLFPQIYHLCMDRYGNHCIKQLIITGSYEINMDVVDFLRSRWYELCCHQFGNTVVQTCLRTYHEHVLSFAEIITGEALTLMQVTHS